ncbi:MAG TPA: hypothetical protein VK492_17475 [Chitinophagaceae bacterium]|nr:hypothetical protein [Chitinophagaceae bacterium]
MAFDVPVLFIVFNRPDTTAIVFERIREIKPQKLFVAADGPRASKEGEKEKCEAVRNLILSGIDWECDVQTKFSDVNLGCGMAESSAMLWFFNAIGEGIVLEDDTLPDPSFFNYCRELLKYFRNDTDIFLISGDNFQDGKQRGDGSYYFSKYPNSWGYASWKRAWEGYDFSLRSIDFNLFERLLNQQFSHEDEKQYWKNLYDNFHKGRYDTWDFQFIFNMWHKKGVGVIPNTNLISNIGFGNNATHTVNADSPSANKAVGSISRIDHPTSRNIHHEADRYLFKTFIKGESTWQRRFRKIRSLFKV